MITRRSCVGRLGAIPLNALSATKSPPLRRRKKKNSLVVKSQKPLCVYSWCLMPYTFYLFLYATDFFFHIHTIPLPVYCPFARSLPSCGIILAFMALYHDKARWHTRFSKNSRLTTKRVRFSSTYISIRGWKFMGLIKKSHHNVRNIFLWIKINYL